LLRVGPAGHLILPPIAAIPNRPMSVIDEPVTSSPHHPVTGE
jgi:cytochrome d ubiquinol oxidase subunit I